MRVLELIGLWVYRELHIAFYTPFPALLKMDPTVFRLPSSSSASPLVPETAYDTGIELLENTGYGRSPLRADL